MPSIVPGKAWSAKSDGSETPGSTTVSNVSAGPSDGSNLALYVFALLREFDEDPVATVTLGGSGTGWERIDAQISSSLGANVDVWRLLSPDTDGSNLQLTYSSNANDALVYVVLVKDVDQTTPEGTPQIWDGTSTTKQISVTTTTADSIILGGFSTRPAAATSGPPVYTPGTGVTELYDDATGSASTDAYGFVGWMDAGTVDTYTFEASGPFGQSAGVAFEVFAATADPGVTGSGALSAGNADASGTGASGSTGSGTPAAGNATASGAGTSGSTGTGTPAAGASTVEGVGTVGFPAITGSGSLGADGAAVEGSGVSASTGTGTLASGAATASGEGSSGSVGSGNSTADAATVEGAGESGTTGTGDLEAGASIVRGTAANIITGSGDLVAGDAGAAGEGNSGSVGSGSPAAGNAAADGAGQSGSTGSGALVIQFPTVAGMGASGSTGSGVLAAVDAAVMGFESPAVTLGQITVSDEAVTTITVTASLVTTITASDSAATRITARDQAA